MHPYQIRNVYRSDRKVDIPHVKGLLDATIELLDKSDNPTVRRNDDYYYNYYKYEPIRNDYSVVERPMDFTRYEKYLMPSTRKIQYANGGSSNDMMIVKSVNFDSVRRNRKVPRYYYY